MNRLGSWLCKIFIAPIVRILFIKEIKGWDNIPEKTNFILASNHQSHLDWIINGYSCIPRRFHFIGQTDQYGGLLKLGLYILYFLAGVIGLNRKSEISKKQVVEEAIKVLNQGDCLIIYPEGTRTRTGEIGPAKYGTAKFALETGVAILPTAIKGTFELLPPKGKLKIRKIVKVSIGKPMHFRQECEKAKNLDKESEEYRDLSKKITEKMMDEIISLKSELDKNP